MKTFLVIFFFFLANLSLAQKPQKTKPYTKTQATQKEKAFLKLVQNFWQDSETDGAPVYKFLKGGVLDIDNVKYTYKTNATSKSIIIYKGKKVAQRISISEISNDEQTLAVKIKIGKSLSSQTWTRQQ